MRGSYHGRNVFHLGTWNWLIFGFILMALELLAPGVFMFWLGLAALLVGLVSFAINPSWQTQLLMFAIFAVPRCRPGATSPAAPAAAATARFSQPDQGADRPRIHSGEADRRWYRHGCGSTTRSGASPAPMRRPAAGVKVVQADGASLTVRWLKLPRACSSARRTDAAAGSFPSAPAERRQAIAVAAQELDEAGLAQLRQPACITVGGRRRRPCAVRGRSAGRRAAPGDPQGPAAAEQVERAMIGRPVLEPRTTRDLAAAGFGMRIPLLVATNSLACRYIICSTGVGRVPALAAIAPLEPPYAPDIAAQFDRIMRGAPPLILFASSPATPAPGRNSVPAAMLDRGPLSLREREIVIDRTCARTGCEYEWGVHVATFAQAAHLTEEQLRATVTGLPMRHAVSPAEQALIAAVDALHERAHAQRRRIRGPLGAL